MMSHLSKTLLSVVPRKPETLGKGEGRNRIAKSLKFVNVVQWVRAEYTAELKSHLIKA